jgi:hypothetical protein
MKFLCLCSILVCLSPVNALIRGSKDAEDAFLADVVELVEARQLVASAQSHRELIGAGVCARIVQRVVGTALPVDCTCKPAVIPPSLTVSCSTANPVCIIPPQILCGSPGLGFSISLLNIVTGGLPVGVTVCFTDVTVLGFPIPNIPLIPLCISPGGGILGILLGGGGGTLIPGPLDGGTPIPAKEEKCTAGFGKLSCKSCTIDTATAGVKLDCSNIDPTWVSTDFVPLPTFD